MPLFRKKSVTIEAVYLSWGTWSSVCDVVGDVISPENPARSVETFSDTCGEPGPMYIEFDIPTLEGVHTAKHGDWIIKGVKGELHLCKPDIFEATYSRMIQVFDMPIAIHPLFRTLDELVAFMEKVIKVKAAMVKQVNDKLPRGDHEST